MWHVRLNPIPVMAHYIRWFTELGIGDVPLVGGKNASLGELFREFAAEGIAVPAGFAVTAEAYRFFIHEAGLAGKIADELGRIEPRNVEDLRQRGALIRNAILAAPLPEALEREIAQAYSDTNK